MRLLVCGGRDFDDFDLLNEELMLLAGDGIDLIIHGAARGADQMAGEWAKLTNTPVLAFPADWEKHGRSAGPIRNARMLLEGAPSMVLAFPGGRGTEDMISRALRSGVPVKRAAS